MGGKKGKGKYDDDFDDFPPKGKGKGKKGKGKSFDDDFDEPKGKGKKGKGKKGKDDFDEPKGKGKGKKGKGKGKDEKDKAPCATATTWQRPLACWTSSTRYFFMRSIAESAVWPGNPQSAKPPACTWSEPAAGIPHSSLHPLGC